LSAKVDEINELYEEKYTQRIDSHPSYLAEWNKFYMEKSAIAVAKRRERPTSKDVEVEWIHHFMNRLRKLQEQDIFVMKIRLRQELDLPTEAEEVKKLKKIESEAKTMINVKNPVVSKSPQEKRKLPKKPIVDLSELLTSMQIPTNQRSRNDSGVASNDESLPSTSQLMVKEENSKKPEKVTLENSEIVKLFEVFDSLSAKEQKCLQDFMDVIQKNDPERHSFLTSYQITSHEEDSDENSKEEPVELDDAGKVKAEVEGVSSDDDDYPLENLDVINKAAESASVVEIISDISIVDLTQD
jgi:hypothetical protein